MGLRKYVCKECIHDEPKNPCVLTVNISSDAEPEKCPYSFTGNGAKWEECSHV